MAVYRGTGGSGTANDVGQADKIAADAASAAASAAAAATSATEAATAVTTIGSAVTDTASSEAAAATSASEASTSATNAATSETNAANSASAAATSETNAAASEANVASSASAATTAASNASTSESNAASSESSASSSAGVAALNATSAFNSASSASTSASNAATSAAEALAAQQAIDGLYLGAQASDPTLDNNGDPVTAGDWYFNTANNTSRIYNGTSWQVTVADLSGVLTTANNLSDLNDAATARTNLGLGTAATTASTDYATAAQGALANSATQPGDNISTLTNNSGYITGNQTITLSGDVSGSGTTSISVTVADDSHNHIISNVDGLQTALNGKQASGTYLSQGGSITSGTVTNLTSTTANISTVDLGDWTITESSGILYFATSGVNKMKLDASGNLTVTGNVTAYGTV